MKTMNHFFQPQAKAPEPKMIHWKTKRQGLEGTTARVDVFMKARIGSHVMHTKHGKATLLGQPATDLLEIEIKTTDTSEWPVPGGILTTRKIVDALDCYDHAVAIARERDPSIYLTESDETLAKAVVSRAIKRAFKAVVSRACGEPLEPAAKPTAPTAKGKGKAKAVEPAAPKEPKKRGRPKGSKDNNPGTRPPRSVNNKLAWVYDGSKAAKGRQVAMIGAAVEHDGLGRAILLEQIDLEHLQLQAGAEGNEYEFRVESNKCFAVDNLELVKAAGSSGAGGSGTGDSDVVQRKRRKTGGRTRKELTETDKSHGLNPLSKKADVERVQKRKTREEEARKRGKPLKPVKPQMNRKWPPALKDQAVAVYNAKFSVGKEWQACTNFLLNLPGFEGSTRANVQSWVIAHAKRAAHEPNEYGLLVIQTGRPPVVPPELYEELKTLVKSLAATGAICVCATSMRPIVRSTIVHRLGTDVIRPGKGGFTCSNPFLHQLARDSELRWRKPYGDARKPPADAEEQIEDMRLRLAYWMFEFSIPRALVLNFDHTGLHFMQQRGNTYTTVEEDTQAAHQSCTSKQKETKLKGANTARFSILRHVRVA